MIAPLKKMFQRKSEAERASVPGGERVYAIGDIHGCADLFGHLIEAIEADDAQRNAQASSGDSTQANAGAPRNGASLGNAQGASQANSPANSPQQSNIGETRTSIILLGDLVDRGPESAKVIDQARAWREQRRTTGGDVRILAGNHEEMFLESFEKTRVLRQFIKFGGRETILSYGIDRKAYQDATIEQLQAMICAHIPPEHRQFLAELEDMIAIGDYLFVHAGVNPEREIDAQKRGDLRWIREDFLGQKHPFAQVIVHGHTIFKKVELGHKRIGIDTGAYMHGRLTALVLEGKNRAYIQARESASGAIDIHSWDD